MNFLSANKPASRQEKCRILYVGDQPETVEEILSHINGNIGMRSISGVAKAMAIVRSADVDCIIVDQRRESNEAALLTAALAGESSVKKIVILTSPENADSYETLGSKCKVLFYPVAPLSLIDAVFEGGQAKSNKNPKTKKAKQVFKKIVASRLRFLSISRTMIPIVSFVYKNTALVLLAALFSVFISYGIMIVFFLVSTHWGSPLTLSTGHELVTKTQNQISDLKIKRNLVAQRYSKENKETEQARQRFADAKVLARFVADTIDGEIKSRLSLQKDTHAEIARLEKLYKKIAVAVGKTGQARDLREKFRKRLINRQTFNSSQLAMLELQQRGNGLLTQIASERRKRVKITKSILMLESMRLQIQQPNIKKIVAADAEFVPLGNQVIDVKTALTSAKVELVSHSERLALLGKNAEIIDGTIKSLSATPLARAVKTPVTVIFAPYGNSKNFKPGQPIYACRFGITWCTKVGKTGITIPGEVVAVHPLFGKNMRGSFVEAVLSDKEAAKKEVLHVGRPPLFF